MKTIRESSTDDSNTSISEPIEENNASDSNSSSGSNEPVQQYPASHKKKGSYGYKSKKFRKYRNDSSDSDNEHRRFYNTKFRNNATITGREPPLYIKDEIPIPRLVSLDPQSIEDWKADIINWTALTSTPLTLHSMILFAHMDRKIHRRIKPHGIDKDTVTYDAFRHPEGPKQAVTNLVRVINLLPKMQPAELNGEKVAVKYTIPITILVE